MHITRLSAIHVILALAVVSCAARAMIDGVIVTMNGRVLSSDIQVIHGHAYIALDDVARMLNRTIEKTGPVYNLSPATGLDGANASTGKMTKDIASGPWILNIADVKQSAIYNPLLGADKSRIYPQVTGDVVTAVHCRLINGTNKMQSISFDKNASGNTAVMDEREHGYMPIAYDARCTSIGLAKLAPRASLDFVVLFSMPNGANLTKFTYSVAGVGVDQSTEFHVSLKR